MLVVLFVLLLVAALLYRLHRRWFGHVLVLLAGLLFFGMGCGPIPHVMLDSLQGPYYTDPAIDWAPRNAIVLLGAGTVGPGDEALQPSYFANGRIVRAAQLYNACKLAGKACHLFVSGGDSQDHGEPESIVYGRALRKLGIPEADLTLEARSMTTWQNAQFIRPLLAQYAPQHIVLVTSGVHLQRSLLYFAHFGITPQPVAGDWIMANWIPIPVSWNFVVTDSALHEYLGILRYRVYTMMGWNAPKAPPLPS
ncbi:YdcF family protein [Dyella humicola]|uniref:YdcF family protein n=1 Tax=Dyella humicola TaxID=2992126 RepID=UPI00224F4236|nr:YdcF family protein [Dyella humicola]